MACLETKYMGLQLANPLVAAASGLTKNCTGVRKLADAGIGAVVLASIFEEQIAADVDEMRGPDPAVGDHPEALEYIQRYGTAHASEHYLRQVSECAAAVDIPVIASIHCKQTGSWVNFARQVVDAGAAALELNVFIPPFDPSVDGRQIEETYFRIARDVKKAVKVPVAIKLGTHFSGMANFLMNLSCMVDGLVLFNRFYRMTVDIEAMKHVPAIPYSESREYETSGRWVSGMHGIAKCDMAANTGIYTPETAIRMLLVGASTVQLCSVLYQEGFDSIGRMKSGISDWMDRHGYARIEDFRGKMSRNVAANPRDFDRVQFMKFSVSQE